MPNTFASFIGIFYGLVKELLLVLVALAFLFFFFGVVKFIAKSGDSRAVAEGRQQMLWGLIAIFIIVSVWGILRFIYGEFGFSRPFGLPYLP